MSCPKCGYCEHCGRGGPETPQREFVPSDPWPKPYGFTCPRCGIWVSMYTYHICFPTTPMTVSASYPTKETLDEVPTP